MKRLSEIDGYLNENLKPGTIPINNGMAVVKVERTEDGRGFSVEVLFQGDVLEADLPSDAEQQLKDAAGEMVNKLGWLL